MVAEMTCYTYLGHIRNPRIYAVPPNYAVFSRFYFHPKNRVKWGEYCISVFLLFDLKIFDHVTIT